MSTAVRQNGVGTNGRKNRSGNGLNSFPFDKLSVDGAAIAKMIISPAGNPGSRGRDPLDNRDNTDTTIHSSSDEGLSGKSKTGDQFEEVDISPKRSNVPTKLDSTQNSAKTRSSSSKKSRDPEPTYRGIFGRTASNVRSSDSDSYYEVYDSDHPTNNNSYRYRNSDADYYSDVISSTGWESGMSVTLSEEGSERPHKHLQQRMASYGKRHAGSEQNQKQLPKHASLDPDGVNVPEDNRSTTGEDLAPTPDIDNTQNVKGMGASVSSDEFIEYEMDDVSFNDVESPPPPVSNEKVTPRSSTFPSYRFLVCLTITIIVVAIGLVAGITYYFWERPSLDPMCPPDDPCCSNPLLCPDSELNENAASGTPLMPTDEELLKLFHSVVGDDVKSDFTSAGKAANWMLNEDPGKLLKPRSDQAWIQRYLLVYTYYATTLNRSTEWLSCNPLTEEELKLADSDACMFTYPTELPGGNVIYDMVPSHRWLSAVDECQWGGVACGKTVADEIIVGTSGNGSNIPIKSTMKRSAVTSIVLADQNLKGSIVTELTALPELQVLDLSHNGLQGTIDESFGSLQTLRLQYNALQGSIPKNLFSSKTALRELNVGSNLMVGTIPDEIGLASQMTDVYLFGNKFSGTIPALGNMPLVNFHAQQNALTGMMPFDYGFNGAWPNTLREWWVYDNKLTGPISTNLGFITNLEDFRVNNNKLTGSIPESIEDLDRLFRFDLHTNALTGTVPESIGSLPQLRDVRLQFNNLGGEVPTSLCFLESMEVLEADCLSFVGQPQTECNCCTTCCNADLGGCQFY